MFVYLLFALLSIAQALEPTCEECHRGLNKNLGQISAVNSHLEAMGHAEEHQAIMQESLAPAQEIQVPAVYKNKPMDEKDLKAIMDVNYTEPAHATIFFVTRVPTGSLRSEGRNECGGEMTESNTMLHGTILQRRDDPTQIRKHVVDAVGRTIKVGCEIGDKHNELSVSARLFQMVDKPLVFYPVSDNAIEKFHSLIGQDNPYGRKELGMNRMVMELQDTKGNKLSGEEGKLYVLPITVKRGFFKTLQESDKSRTTLNYGTQIQVPVPGPFAHGGAGVYGNLAHHHKVTDNSFISAAAGMGVNIQRNFSKGYSTFDEKAKITTNGFAALAWTCVDPKDQSKNSLVLSASIESAALDGKKYSETRATRFVDQQSRNAATKSDLALGLAYVYEDKSKVISVGCQEDFGGYKRRNGTRTFDGHNNRDFSCNAKFTKRF